MLDEKRIQEIKERASKASLGPWWPGCIVNPDTKCQCRYILSEGYGGCIAEVDVDNGKNVTDGGNGSPSLEEAIGNANFIANSREDIPFLLKTIEDLRAAAPKKENA